MNIMRGIALACAVALLLTGVACTTVENGRTIRIKTAYPAALQTGEQGRLPFLDLFYTDIQSTVQYDPGAFDLFNWDYYGYMLRFGLIAKDAHHVRFKNFLKRWYTKWQIASTADVDRLASDGSIFQAGVAVRDARRDPTVDEADSAINAILRSTNFNTIERRRELIDEVVASTAAQGRKRPELETRDFENRLDSGEAWRYPQIDIDFSGNLNLLTEESFLSDVGFFVQLDEATDERVRIIDYTPKGTIARESKLGDHTVRTGISAGAGDNDNDRLTTKIIEDEENEATIFTESRSDRSSSVNYNEDFRSPVMQLTETMTVGLIDNGRGFYARHQARGNRRVAGTHDYSLLMKVPEDLAATGDDDTVSTKGAIRARAFAVGIVNHVERPGYKGYLYRVPEPTNSDVFEQAVYYDLGEIDLWDSANAEGDTLTVKVISNNRDARYILGLGQEPGVVEEGLDTGRGVFEEFRIRKEPGKDYSKLTVQLLDIHAINDRQGLGLWQAGEIKQHATSPGDEYLINAPYKFVEWRD